MDIRAFKLPKTNVKIDKITVDTSEIINESGIQYGFNIFIKKNRDKLDILKTLPQSQQYIYKIMNTVESTIYSNVEDSISTAFKKKLKKDDISFHDDFFKMWEMITDFKLLDVKKNLTTVSIGSGHFMQAISVYRNMNSEKDSKTDLYCGISIYEDSKKEVLCFTPNVHFFDMPKEDTPTNNIKLFKKDFVEKTKDHFKKKQMANLVTADGGNKELMKNFEEQEMYELIIGEIVTGLTILSPNGDFVLKIYDIFTSVTIKLLMIFSQFFDEIHIVKPHTSNDNLNEKYAIGKKYKENADLLKKLTSLFTKINKNKTDYIVDIFSDLKIDENFVKEIIKINYKLIDTEYRVINNMYQFILEKNYFGVKYHEYVNSQVENSKLWLKRYF